MSSEQQERQAIQYAERSAMFTVKILLKLLEWSARHALAQDSAYKVGVQKLEELLQSPYAIESLNISVKTSWINPSMSKNLRNWWNQSTFLLPLVGKEITSISMLRISRSLDKHLDELLQKLVSNPEKLQGLTYG